MYVPCAGETGRNVKPVGREPRADLLELGCGVMVALGILVPSVRVRSLTPQQS